VLPAASVALALKAVVVLSPTSAGRPGSASSAAVPVASGVPAQAALPYRVTVEPPSAVPFSINWLLLLGEFGSESSSVGAAGAVESST
jgi:hypothetical protein